MPGSYFRPLAAGRFQATEHTSGAWDPSEQHIGPSLGLLLHAVEADRDARRDDGLVIGRLSYDILGTVPVAEMEVAVRVVRPGRTIELVEATLEHAGRTIVALRAWLMCAAETTRFAGTPFEPMAPRHEMTPWVPSSVWPGGFIASADVYRSQREPGRAAYWVRPTVDLIDQVPVSPLVRAAGIIDIANGMTVRESPDDVVFPNIDLTAHFFAQPQGEWLGFDTSVSFGTGGIGLTHSILHDDTGPIGALSQILTVRPR